MKFLLTLLILSFSLPGLASDPKRNPSQVGEVLSDRLVLESSGFFGSGRFTALPRGDWRLIRKEALWGNNATHTGYVLKAEDKANAAALLIVVHSTTPNYWNASFSATPSDARALNLYSTSGSNFVTKQSFFFPDMSLTQYQASWLEKLKVKETVSIDYPGEKFALAVTRNIDRTNDIRFITVLKRLEQDSTFEAKVRAWNDQLVTISHDSFYGKKEGLGGLLAFREGNQAQTGAAEPPLGVSQVTKPTGSPPDNRLSNAQDSKQLQAQAILKEAELTAARLENERLRQQLQASQRTPSVDKLTTNAVAETPKPDDSKIFSGAKRHALIIGNNDYRNVPKLDNAVGDARSIAALLSKLEYEVVAHNNLGEKQFRTALRQFKQKLKGGEEVIFFFAGHGVQLGSANYLLPTDIGSDSEDQIRDEGIALQRVLDDFSESRVKFSLAVVDACRDNPFKSTGRSIGGRGLAQTSAATGQMIIFSAGAGQQALDRLGRNDKEKNGLFTRVLIDKVGKSKDPIHLLMRDVRSEVAKLAQTVGHEQVPAIYDQVIGDFYFIPRR